MRRQIIILFLAVIFYNGFFACNTFRERGEENKQGSQMPGKEPAIPGKPFDCSKDSLVPLGYIDTGWVFRNPGLGIRFRYPLGWNAMDDIHMASPSFIAVGSKLKVFRKQYLKPRASRLEIMKQDGWKDPRFLFGITQMNSALFSEYDTPLYDDSVYAAAYVFYAEHVTESKLYNDILESSLEQWKRKENASIFALNKATMGKIKKQQIGSDTFYTQVIRMPVKHGVINIATSIKKRGCLFMLLVFHWYKEKEYNEMIKAMNGLQLSNW